MNQEAEQYTRVFECLGQEVLTMLEPVPQLLLHQPFPCLDGDSLFRRALRVKEESEHWIIDIFEGHKEAISCEPDLSGKETHADLQTSYRIWLDALHRQLEATPGALLSCFIQPPTVAWEVLGGELVTIRACLLYALGQSAMHVGHIQHVCQHLAEIHCISALPQRHSPCLLNIWRRGPSFNAETSGSAPELSIRN